MNSATTGWHGRTALVTGGLGFVGSALVRALASAGATVRVLDALLPQSGGSPRHISGLVSADHVILDDVRSRDAVDTAVRGADAVFHLAGAHGLSALSPDWFTEIDTACLGMLHLLEAVRLRAPAARVVFASDLSVYGCQPLEGLPVREDAPLRPQTLHGVHKATGEQYCGVYHRQYGLETVVARLAWCIGPRQRLTGSANGTVANVLDAVLHDEDVVLPGGGGPLDVLDVDDAAAALLALGTQGTDAAGLTVNVSMGKAVSLSEIAGMLVEVAGQGRLRNAPGPAPCGIVADASRLRAMAPDWAPRPLRVTLERTLAWYFGDTDAA